MCPFVHIRKYSSVNKNSGISKKLKVHFRLHKVLGMISRD